MHEWRQYVVDSDALDNEHYTNATYRLAPKSGLTPHEAVVDILRIITHRALEYSPSVREKWMPAVSVGRVGEWTDVTLSIPELYWQPGDGLGHLLELLSSVAEYDFTSGTWLHRIDFSRAYLDRFKGPSFGIHGIRRLVDVPERPLLAATIGPRGVDLDFQLTILSDALNAGFDLIVDDILLGSASESEFKYRVGSAAATIARSKRRANGRALYMCVIGGRPSVALRLAEVALAEGADGFVVNPFVQGFDFLEDLSTSFPNAVVFATNMGSGMVSRPTSTSEDAGIDEQVYSKLSRISGADAVHAGTTGTSCYDATWDDAIGALSRPLRTLRDEFPAAAAIAEGGIEYINIWPNMRTLGMDTIFEINTSVSLARDTKTAASTFVRLVKELAEVDSREKAWAIYESMAKHDTKLRAQIESQGSVYETWI